MQNNAENPDLLQAPKSHLGQTEFEIVNAQLLVVDDEPEICQLLKELLLSVTPHIQTAAHGQEALEIVKMGQIDTVLSDIQMPVMNGLALLSEIRKLWMVTPFVILTTYGDKRNRLEAMRNYATDFLEKPFDKTKVMTVIHRTLRLGLELRQLEKELEVSLNSPDVPVEEGARQKYVKKVLFGMRYGSRED